MLIKSLKSIAILVVALTAFSCKTVEKANQKEIKPFVGIWNDTTNPGTKVVFRSDGSFYNIYKENDVQIVTHSGTFKVLSGNTYVLTITDARPNAAYDLKGRQYANYYTLSADGKTMKTNGAVDGRNGGKGLTWASTLVKVDKLD
ncbi:hypothetical protein LX99_02904 [Mucilaginibacter oryzae]|uniref:Lipocalin-like protein n=1 Tax=Mucilaginibacter oryzae TaxID=468058 RepID=A0A316H7Y3_9SPHI|nr:hypothetical protein [Mucilaginibacter oryzae]PWK77094.1 hypothetical protein LX99_02904 [Mucilaginibacter oryzae]